MISEWLSLRNEFRSKVKFVLHSRDKIKRLSLKRSRERGFAPDHWYASAIRSRLKDLRFSIRNEIRFQFTRYQNEISYQNENFIPNENRSELIPELLVRERNVVSAWCKQIQRNNYGDGMSSFQNESHYGIKWIALLTIWSDDSRVTFLYFPLGKSDSLPLMHSDVVLSLLSFSSWIFDSWMLNCFLAVLLCSLGRGLSFLISSFSSSELWK